MTVTYNIFAYREGEPTTKKNFLVESAAGGEIAKALFIAETPGWEPELYRPAQCFASGEHKGELSVWEGKNGTTVILCQLHGENPK